MKIRIGYHRVSDDSVSSGEWDSTLKITHVYIADLMTAYDIDSVWLRDVTPDPMSILKHAPVFLKGDNVPSNTR
jgi:hypothetical protein